MFVCVQTLAYLGYKFNIADELKHKFHDTIYKFFLLDVIDSSPLPLLIILKDFGMLTCLKGVVRHSGKSAH